MSAKFAAVVGAALVSGCAYLSPHPDWVQTPKAADLEPLLSGQALVGEPVRAEELPDYDLMALSGMMEVIAEEIAYQYSDSYRRAEALHRTLMSSQMSGGQGLRYSALKTAPAAQAFASGEVNCLSYSLIFVSMARHMGLRAHINDVAVPPSWSLRGEDSFLFFRHVNAKVQLPRGGTLVVDLEMEQYSPVYSQRVISDELAAAQFYNNRGMELLADGETRAGFLHLKKALQLDSRQSFIWGNLGTLYSRRGHSDLAETAYLQGLALDPRDLTIVSNLGRLYASRGEPEKADYFTRMARAHRNSNPYYLFARAQEQFEAGDMRQAQRLLDDALSRERKEPRFYALAAKIYERRQLPERAERMRAEQQRWSEELYF